MSSTERGRASIFVVDDEPVNLHLLERLLRGAGYVNLTCTSDAQEVKRLYFEIDPDLILLDLHMPVMDGFEVLGQLKGIIPESEYLPVLVLTADATQASKQKALASGAMDFLTKPFDRSEVLARIRNLLHTRELHVALREHNGQLEERVRHRTKELWEAVQELERAQQGLRLAQEETIHSLSLAAEFRDDETSRHIERMSRYCLVIARGMGWDERRSDLLRIAAKMHDIGKIGVPDRILRKRGRLTPDEFEAMKQHPQIGYEILKDARSDLARLAASIAWTHHERFDGTGYPRGLAAEEIPLAGRIGAVADVFDALTTNRVYRRRLKIPAAISMMRAGRGDHFCPAVLDAFFESMSEIVTMKEQFDEE
jgi:putative two-component system response regulator